MNASIWAYAGDPLPPGFDVMSCAVIYHAATLLTPDAHVRPVTPGARFRPGPGYRGLRPPCVAEDAEAAAAACPVPFHAWTVLLHDDGAVSGAPRQQTCFGDPMPHCMCPSQASVRAYCEDVVADLASRSWVDGLDVESLYFSQWPHEWHHVKYGVTPASVALSTCFCEACRRRAAEAGVDWLAARADAQRRARHELPPATEPSAYDQVRCDAISSLLASCKRAAGNKPFRPILSGGLLPDLWQVGVDPEAWRQHEVIVTLYGEARRKAVQAHALLGPFVAGLNACDPYFAELEAIPQARGYALYHAGLVPPERLRLPFTGQP